MSSDLKENIFKKEDWEFSDRELLLEIKRHILNADPFNGNRSSDIKFGDLIIHAADRIQKIRSIHGTP